MFRTYSKQPYEAFENILTIFLKNIYTDYSKSFNKNENTLEKIS